MIQKQSVFSFTFFCGVMLTCLNFGAASANAQDDIKRIMPTDRVLTVVEPESQPQETFSLPKPLAGVKPVPYKPNYLNAPETATGLTTNVISRHDVGCLEFTYKPLRTVSVDVPQPSGQMRRKVITYLIYRVRNLGDHLTSKEVVDEFGYKSYQIVKSDQISPDAEIETFEPHFVLSGWVENFTTGKYEQKSYLEVYHPYVVAQLERVDRTPAKLHDWHTITKQAISVTKEEDALGTWGVAIWEDVDPTINFMSVYVSDLTNAYRVSEKADGSAVLTQKTLQLNFYRSGDGNSLEQDSTQIGIPLSKDLREQAIYARFYHLPGPAVRAYEVEVGTDRTSPLFVIDAKFDSEFDSLMLGELMENKLPQEVADAFAALQIPVPAGTSLVNKIAGIRWEFQIRDGDRIREFRVDHEPRFWVKRGRGLIEIVSPVDNFWIYR
jgi:hypothetical protein